MQRRRYSSSHNEFPRVIDEKPTWKHVFVNRHCLVPLTDFIEPIYEGEHWEKRK